MTEQDTGHKWFDRKVNPGHVLTFVGMTCAIVAAFAAGWGAIDKRVTILEEDKARQAERYLLIKESMAEIKSDTRETNRVVNEMRLDIAQQLQQPKARQ